MRDIDLVDEITMFLRSTTAYRICRPYGAEPRDALGEIYLRLLGGASKPIRKPTAWVRTNATFLLRNYLRRENSRLYQPSEI